MDYLNDHVTTRMITYCHFTTLQKLSYLNRTFLLLAIPIIKKYHEKILQIMYDRHKMFVCRHSTGYIPLYRKVMSTESLHMQQINALIDKFSKNPSIKFIEKLSDIYIILEQPLDDSSVGIMYMRLGVQLGNKQMIDKLCDILLSLNYFDYVSYYTSLKLSDYCIEGSEIDMWENKLRVLRLASLAS